MQRTKDHYGFDVKSISNLNEIEPENSIHYIYQVDSQNIHFLYRPAKTSQGILVAFHGARLNSDGTFVPLPLFRAFDYPEKIEGMSLLSFSDPLLQAYDHKALRLAWYLDSIKFKTSMHLDDIIEYVRVIDATDNMLFLGSSGGGFPAIKHAGVFKMKALISNSQLILKNYPYFEEFTATLSGNNDKISESSDIRDTVSKNTHPSRIILYINELDNRNLKENAEVLCRYLEKNGLAEILDYHPFKKEAPPGKTPHHVQWDCKLEDLIKKILKINTKDQ